MLRGCFCFFFVRGECRLSYVFQKMHVFNLQYIYLWEYGEAFSKQPSLDICTETVGYQILQHVAPAWTPSKPIGEFTPFFCLNTPNVIIALIKTTRVIVVLLMHFSFTSWHHICLLVMVQVRINTGLMGALTQGCCMLQQQEDDEDVTS